NIKLERRQKGTPFKKSAASQGGEIKRHFTLKERPVRIMERYTTGKRQYRSYITYGNKKQN
ncbi:hypothetical protein ACSQMP_003552, partial [Salmonella enterica]